VHEVFQCLKQTSILNGHNLHGKILKFNLLFILKFEILVIFFFFFFFVACWVKNFHERHFVMMFDGCTCG